MNEEEKEALLNLEHIVKHWKPDDENDELANIEYNSIKVAVELIDKLEKSNKEWFDIADDILRATNKYGEISIGEVANYIDKLQKENEELKEQRDNAIKLRNEIIEEEKELKEEIDDLIKENHKHIDYIASMKKKQEDKIRTKIKEIKEKHYKDELFTRNQLIYVLEKLLGDDEDE